MRHESDTLFAVAYGLRGWHEFGL